MHEVERFQINWGPDQQHVIVCDPSCQMWSVAGNTTWIFGDPAIHTEVFDEVDKDEAHLCSDDHRLEVIAHILKSDRLSLHIKALFEPELPHRPYVYTSDKYGNSEMCFASLDEMQEAISQTYPCELRLSGCTILDQAGDVIGELRQTQQDDPPTAPPYNFFSNQDVKDATDEAVGTIHLDGSLHFADTYLEQLGIENDTDAQEELTSSIRSDLRAQITGEQDASWSWGEFPPSHLRFAFADRGQEYIDALLEFGRCVTDSDWGQADEYASIIATFAAGDEPFPTRAPLSGEEPQVAKEARVMFADWQKRCEQLGLQGWPTQQEECPPHTPTVRLLNSAMMPAAGTYRLEQLTPSEFGRLVQQAHIDGVLKSYIGYEQTAAIVQQMSGVPVEVCRDPTPIESGDVMLVIKLKYRVADPKSKGAPVKEDFEYQRAFYTAGQAVCNPSEFVVIAQKGGDLSPNWIEIDPRKAYRWNEEFERNETMQEYIDVLATHLIEKQRWTVEGWGEASVCVEVKAALRTVYARHSDGEITDLELARREWGSDVVTGYPSPHLTGPVAPYDPALWEVVGYVAMHRTGPRIPVLRKK